MKLAVLVPVIVLSLSGCSTLQAATGTVSDVVPAAMLDAKKALTAAHALHEAVADGATIAANTNLCISTCATKAKGYLDLSEAYLLQADAAVKAADTVGVQAKVSAAITIIANVENLISGKK